MNRRAYRGLGMRLHGCNEDEGCMLILVETLAGILAVEALGEQVREDKQAAWLVQTY
jgi:hypothetical protein